MLLMLLAIRLACAQPEAILTGHLPSHDADSVLVSWRATPFDEHECSVGVLPNSRGDFELRVPLSGPLAAELSVGDADTPLFLEPGNALRVKLEQVHKEVQFRFQAADGSAQAAAANNYLAEFTRRFVDDVEFQVLPDNVRLLEAPFLSFLDYRQKAELKLLRGLDHDQVTPAFLAFAEAEIRCATANDHLTYPELRAATVGMEPLPVGPDFYDFLSDPTLLPADPAASLSPQYQELGINYIHYQVRHNGPAPTEAGYYPACYREAGRHPNGNAVVQGLVVLETIRNGHIAHANALLADYAAHSGAPAAWSQQLRQQLVAHRPHAMGSPPPPLPTGLRSVQGDTVNLRKYVGKLVYLLLWDTRLPASQREIQPLRDLMRRFAYQPVQFVALALDEQDAAWRRLMAQAPPMPGVQVLVPPAAGAALRTAYDPTGLPAAVLLAEDGTILQFRARRPSHQLLPADIKWAFGRAAAYRAVKLP